MKLLERQYGNPFKLLAYYRNEIKRMTKIKLGDESAFRRLFNFLIKCQSLQYSYNQNPLDTPDVICMILSKIPGVSTRQMEQTCSQNQEESSKRTWIA